MSKTSQLRQKAQTLLKKGKVLEAIEAYKKLLQSESRNPNLYNELGDIYLRMDDKLQAVSSLEKAVSNYEKVALYNNAIAVCKKILRIIPSRVDTVFKLGELKAKQKFDCEAARMFMQYLDLVSADAGAMPDNVLTRVEMIIELVSEDDELHSKAAEVLSHVGLKISAAEIFARLIVRSASSKNDEQIDLYRNKLDLLRQSLSADEQTHIEEILAETFDDAEDDDESNNEAEEGADAVVENEEPDLTVEEIDLSAGAQAVGSDPATEEEPELVDDHKEDKDSSEEYEIPIEPESSPETEDDHVISEEEAEVPDSSEDPDAAATKETSPKDEYEIPVEPDAVEDYVIDDAGEEVSDTSDDVNAMLSEDLSDILEAEDEANETSAVDTEKLAEEITSDVEEDDFRSHYDLGMAYIEMALYNEAIRELQISARSEQMQLRSLEMIGHCFLLLDNPRLAVKQLNRGLELAMTTGGDNLAIHYNLGLAFELLGDPDKAREHFEEVYIVDVTFREISDKMKKYSTVS